MTQLKTILKNKIFFTVIFLSSVILAFLIFILYLHLPTASTYSPVNFRIEKGNNAKLIAKKLKEKGLVRSSLLFLYYIKKLGLESKLKAGEYILSKDMSIRQILNYLVEGKTIVIKVAIPEGFTTREIAQLIEKKGLGNNEIFIKLVKTPHLFNFSYEIPLTFDGYLFPDTYYLDRTLCEKDIIQKMLDRFQEIVKYNHIIERSNEIKYSLDNIINIASLIEKEAKVDSERPLISAVLHNRLKRGMALECDATIQFILGNPKKRLYYKDLLIDSPYNSYLYKGLPPRPICNPGLASIESALSPAKANYLFYVLKNDGLHHFSFKASEHAKAKKKYRKK